MICYRHQPTDQLIMHQSLCIVWHLLALATARTEAILRRVDLVKAVICIWEIGCRFIQIDTMRILHAVCHLHHQRQIMTDMLWECHRHLCRHIITKNTSMRCIIDQCLQVLGKIFMAFGFCPFHLPLIPQSINPFLHHLSIPLLV